MQWTQTENSSYHLNKSWRSYFYTWSLHQDFWILAEAPKEIAYQITIMAWILQGMFLLWKSVQADSA